MAKGMKAKAVLVGLGIAAGTLFGAMAPAQGNELSRTVAVESYTAPLDVKTLSDGRTVPEGTSAVDAKTVAALTVDAGRTVGAGRTVDPTLVIGSYTLDAATAKGL